MVLDILKKKIVKEKEFLVTLSGRGKQLPLGRINAKNHQELMSKILEKLNEMGDQALEYSRIRIIDLETLKELKIKNPLSLEDSTQERSEKSKSSLIDANMIIDQFVWFLKMNNQLTSTILAETMKTMANVYGEALKTMAMMKIESASEKPQLDVNSFMNFLNLVMANKDKLEELLKRGLT
jgi:aconitase B